MADHPGIVFRDGPSGRRAGLAGYGIDVWEVVETARNEGGNLEATAAYLQIGSHLAVAALDDYPDYPDEIDAWIESNAALSKEAEAAWRRRGVALSR